MQAYEFLVPCNCSNLCPVQEGIENFMAHHRCGRDLDVGDGG